jgi:hypothetical protein
MRPGHVTVRVLVIVEDLIGLVGPGGQLARLPLMVIVQLAQVGDRERDTPR